MNPRVDYGEFQNGAKTTMMQDILIALVWYLVLAGFGIIALPISTLIFRKMPDGGILLSRPLGWLLLAFFSWWASYLRILPFSWWGISIVGIGLFAFSMNLMKQRPRWYQRLWRRHWKTARNGEILAILAFLLILLARRQDPAIDSTEKPMDAMMLNAMVTANYTPPGDSWMAGFPINYHYGGYLLHSIPVQLTGIRPEIGYNMAFPTVALISVSVAFVLGRALFSRCRWAALTPVCIFFIGNLAGVTGILQRMALPNTIYDWRWGYLWGTSRVIYDNGGSTINEYPFFSILWGDLHPHFANIPFFLFFMVLILALAREALRISPRLLFRYEWPLILVTAIACGFILPTNLFDFPVSAAFFECVLFFVFIHRLVRYAPTWKKQLPLAALFALPVVSYGMALPFALHFIPPPKEGSRLWVSPYHTQLLDFLLVFGLHTAVSLAVLIFRGQHLFRQRTKEETGFVLGLAGIFFLALWAWYGYVVCALAPCMALFFWLLLIQYVTFGRQPEQSGERAAELFALTACALGWSMIAACEFVFLKDDYGITRINTLFKVHFPVWFLLGAALPYLLWREYNRTERTPVRWFVMLPVLSLFGLSLLPPTYTLLAIYEMPADYRIVTLDGLAYMRQYRPEQYALINWVRNNIQPSDRIMEIPGWQYSLDSTVSTFTGRPSVVGWARHEGLWRSGDADTEVLRRENDTVRFYTTHNWEEAKAILQKYQVKYVVVLPIESPDRKRNIPMVNIQLLHSHLQAISFENIPLNPSYALFKVPDSL